MRSISLGQGAVRSVPIGTHYVNVDTPQAGLVRWDLCGWASLAVPCSAGAGPGFVLMLMLCSVAWLCIGTLVQRCPYTAAASAQDWIRTVCKSQVSLQRTEL